MKTPVQTTALFVAFALSTLIAPIAFAQTGSTLSGVYVAEKTVGVSAVIQTGNHLYIRHDAQAGYSEVKATSIAWTESNADGLPELRHGFHGTFVTKLKDGTSFGGEVYITLSDRPDMFYIQTRHVLNGKEYDSGICTMTRTSKVAPVAKPPKPVGSVIPPRSPAGQAEAATETILREIGF